MSAVRLRFVTCDDWISRLIRMQAGISMPFTPSHVEALTQDGLFYIGAHLSGGVKARPVGYDAGTLVVLPSGELSERFVTIPCTADQEAEFYKFMHSKIDEPYDWHSIFGFMAPDVHAHAPEHIICSALITYGIRDCGIFQWPLTVPFHHVSPRDLFLIASTMVEVPH